METLISNLKLGAEPLPDLTIDQWAERERVVSSQSGSPYPGGWSNEIAPYLTEIMQRLSPQDPRRNVIFRKSHQVGGTEVGLNLFGYLADYAPSPTLIVLPTIDEAQRYNRTKLQPMIDATPALGPRRIKEQKARDAHGSTGSFKRFSGGGFAQITGANSSAGLQMLSVRYSIFEEISEWPAEAGDRGDPLALAEKRSTAWSEVGYKRFYVSTPGIKGMCRITDKYEHSDQRQFFVPCPHCHDYIALDFEHLKARYPDPPYETYYACQGCGCEIEAEHKRWMLLRGHWIPTFPTEDQDRPTHIDREELEAWVTRDCKGRDPGYHINQLYSPFVSWDDMMRDWKVAEGNPQREMVFVQQNLGLAWEQQGDAPPWEKIMLRRETYQEGEIPPGALALTGMADVQGDRLEWAVYGWGLGMSGWLVEKGVIPIDPGHDEAWAELSKVQEKRYRDINGNEWPLEAFGVDAGYMSHMVYRFARERRNQRVYALDGRAGHMHPIIGAPKRQQINFRGKKIGSVLLWPTGTYPLKSWVYSSLNKTIEGPDEEGNWQAGAFHFPQSCGEDFFQQLTAEYLAKVDRGGRISLEWKQIQGQANEQLDLAVGALALACHIGLDRYKAPDWEELAKNRGVSLTNVALPATEKAQQSKGASSEAMKKLTSSRRRRRRRTVSSLMT